MGLAISAKMSLPKQELECFLHPSTENPRIAIVHDWFSTIGGAEKVVSNIIDLLPGADLFSLVDFFPQKERNIIKNKKIITSFIQILPFSRKKFRNYFPLFPIAIQQLDLSNYDLIISSSYAVAKGVLTSSLCLGSAE
jgi:hypothetical protein